MASVLLSTYSIGDANLNAVMNSLDGTRRGYSAVSITESTTTTIPQIAAGSMIEVGGALYEFTSASTLAGSPSDGQCYIYFVPSAGSTTVTPTLSSVAPTWSDAKQGWYGTGGSAGYRYLETLKIYKSSGYRKYTVGKEYSCLIRLSSQQTMSVPSYYLMWGSATRDDFLMYSTSSTTTRTYFPLPFSGVYNVLAQVYESSHAGGFRENSITYSTDRIASNMRVQSSGDIIEQINVKWNGTAGGDFRVAANGTFLASTLTYSGSFFSIWATPVFP